MTKLTVEQALAERAEVKRLYDAACDAQNRLHRCCPHPPEHDIVREDPHCIQCGICGRWLDDGDGKRLGTQAELDAFDEHCARL